MPITGSQKALMFAQAGRVRAGASRSNWHDAHLYLTIAGVQRRTNVLIEDVTITDIVDATPNRCSFTVRNIVPTVGQEVILTLGSKNNLDRLFAGHILTVNQVPKGKPSNLFYEVNAIDYTWLLNRRKVNRRYTGQSATAIAKDLIASFTSGFTTYAVQSGLDIIDEITFTDEDVTDALTRLAKLVGGYWDVDYLKDLHLFTGTESGVTNPVDLTSTHVSMNDVTYGVDLSQVVTRAYFEGGGSRALEECAAGETLLPVEDVAWYNSVAGGTVKSGPQRITYAGVIAGGVGSLVGPGVTPSSALVAAGAGGSGIESGAHSYAYTWVTGAGETLPSPLDSVTLGQVTNPTTTPTGYTPSLAFSGSLNTNGAYKVKYVYATDALLTQNTLPSPASATITANANVAADAVGVFPYSTNPAVLYVVIYRTVDGGSTYYRQSGEVNIPAGGTFEVHLGGTSDAVLVTHPTEPVSNTTAVNQVALSGIAVGPTGTTQRKVYRTVAAGSQLKLQQTIANNTATTGTQDSTADASLGADAPSSDTSGLSTTDGTVVAGATSLRVASTGPFSSTGGWAVIGNGEKVVRYTGYSADSLTGIPSSGDGSIAAAVSYGSTVTVAPQLTGIPASGTGAIVYTIKKGADVNLSVQVDDTPAQTALAAQIGGDGIQEASDQDGRFAEAEATARASAMLVQRGRSESSITYHSRDKRTKAGKTITASLGSPTSISGAFKLQEVVIRSIDLAAMVFPTYQVQASATRFSFEDLVHIARKELS